MHGVVTPSQPGLSGAPPEKWSPSSTVTRNSVLRLRDPVCRQALEEGGEGRVVLTQLRLYPGLARTEGVAAVLVVVVVVDVREVGVGDRDSGLLRRGGVAERVVRLHPVEAGEADVAASPRSEVVVCLAVPVGS